MAAAIDSRPRPNVEVRDRAGDRDSSHGDDRDERAAPERRVGTEEHGEREARERGDRS